MGFNSNFTLGLVIVSFIVHIVAEVFSGLFSTHLK